ncbi:RICIN domain-containing protein [Kitasatospora indigofera]|uniref:RICIN domain-containing protein n=1 Tax=Kitasatospora indigofera TaxID=67307 RepID=UPI0033B427AD
MTGRRIQHRRAAGTLLLLALSAGNLLLSPPPAAAANDDTVPGAPVYAATSATDTTVTVDGNGDGRVFDGVGAVSGGGGNSRLLIDYPKAQRDEILDYMFKPGFGADLQILKVEIGGDTNSTDGAEPSHEHVEGDIQCDTGYEWWLMDEAKKRNPDIKLAALAWGAPGWVAAGTSSIWNAKGITYLKDWLGCATQHNLPIDYLGGRNESGTPDAAWFVHLRDALRSAGYGSVKLVADDDWRGFPRTDTPGVENTWKVLQTMKADPAFAGAVDVIGHHYPCEGTNGGTGDTGNAYNCPTPPEAVPFGKPIWASENGSLDMNTRNAEQIRTIVRGYVDGRITATLHWPLIAALYPNMQFSSVGMLQANQPWTGNYTVGAVTWSTAQITQFTKPGWKFIDSASGHLGGNESNGAYVTLRAPGAPDWSTIVEATTAKAPQNVKLQVTNGLSTGPLHVWASKVISADPADYFLQQADLTAQDGSYSFTAQPGYVYSLTTTTGQHKGATAVPPRAPLGLPYSDSFDGSEPHGEAALLSDMSGSFEIRPCGGGRTGQCVRQMAPQQPLAWGGNFDTPYTLVGDGGWRDYTVGVDTLLEQQGSVRLLARVGSHGNAGHVNEYFLQVSDAGAWSIVKSDAGQHLTTLAAGMTTALGTGSWHHLEVTVEGGTITGFADGTRLGSATDISYPTGLAGLGLDGFRTQQFDNLKITPGAVRSNSAVYRITSGLTGQVLGLAGDASAEGAKAVQQPAGDVAGQLWRLTAQGGDYTLTNLAGGKVLDVPGNSTNDGAALQQWTANSGDNQRWRILPAANGSYTVTNKLSGKLVDVFGASSAPGTKIIQYHATGYANQQWKLLPAPVEGAGFRIANAGSGLVLDMSGASAAPGGAAVLWTANGNANQAWDLHTATTPGYYTITNRNSGLCLDVAGNSTADQAKVQQWTCSGAANQQWAFRPAAGEGRWTLVNLKSGKALDTKGGATVKGTGVVQQTGSATATTQQWTLQPA